MDIQKIPLDERLRRLEAGYSAHPEYLPSVICSVAKMPVTDYFTDCEKALKKLRKLLKLSAAAMAEMTYQQLAVLICGLNDDDRALNKAAALMAEPMVQLYKLCLLALAGDTANRPADLPQRWNALPDILRQWARLYTDDYFGGLVELCGDTYFAKAYQDHIHEFNCRDGKDCCIGKIIYDASTTLPPYEKGAVLYYVLLKPFAELERRQIT